jgi:hypothetical protein
MCLKRNPDLSERKMLSSTTKHGQALHHFFHDIFGTAFALFYNYLDPLYSRLGAYDTAVLTHGRFADCSYLIEIHPRDRLTADQVSAMSIRDGERIAPRSVACTEVAFEVHAPELIRCCDFGERLICSTEILPHSRGHDTSVHGISVLSPQNPASIKRSSYMKRNKRCELANSLVFARVALCSMSLKEQAPGPEPTAPFAFPIGHCTTRVTLVP